MTAVETPLFLAKSGGRLIDEEREELVGSIAANPEIGSVIPESGGVRKLGWAAKGEGNAKNQEANLTKAERNQMGALVPVLISAYSKRRTR